MIKHLAFIFLAIVVSSCHGYAAISSTSFKDIATGKCTVIDLTYPLNKNNAYWPAPSYSPFTYKSVATHKDNGVFSGTYSTPEHLGTHIDAPNHFEDNQPSVDELTLESLIGPASVIDISDKVENNADYELTVEDITDWEKVNGRIRDRSIILLNTGWSRRWNDYEKYKNVDDSNKLRFPGYSADAARFLVEERDINGIGIDTLSADYGISKDFAVHHIINGSSKYILENVANLNKLPPTGATLIIAPIKIEGGSGGQARVWAIMSHH
ncbi:MAG: cyclase family protein [Candidatus Scalindua sp.]|jgi:kynurenine formamidase|nr:cyclase family protein [Candidatus Scalindua sp.]MDV5167233.1 cyclase family protein [Candidatus Scalindua sp.]